MERTINGLNYDLRISSRAKRVSVKVCSSGVVSVVVPNLSVLPKAERFLLEHFSWVESKIEFFRKRGFPAPARRSKREFQKYKEAARTLARSRLEYFNQFYGFTYGRISIRNQRSRWGSCSKAGNLNFNYKIALLPPHLADYIIVHELCHRGRFDHSPQFWDLVAKTLPNHKALRREIRRYSL